MKILNYNIAVSKIETNNKGYKTILPESSYSPFLLDKEFQKIYRLTKLNNKIDIYRLYELWELVDQVSKLKGSLIEIGVGAGGSGTIIAKRSELLNPTDKVFLCDTFTGIVKSSDIDMFYNDGDCYNDISFVEDLTLKANLWNLRILKGIFPDDTGRFVSDLKFKFCHIDVDVYQSAKDILDWIWDKMVIGGLIIFDDYGFIGCNGITKLVNEERFKKDRIVIYNINGHGIIVKIK